MSLVFPSYFGKIPMNIASLLFENSDRIIFILNLNNSASICIILNLKFTWPWMCCNWWFFNFHVCNCSIRTFKKYKRSNWNISNCSTFMIISISVTAALPMLKVGEWLLLIDKGLIFSPDSRTKTPLTALNFVSIQNGFMGCLNYLYFSFILSV